MNPAEQLQSALAYLEVSKDGQIAEAKSALLKLLDGLQSDPVACSQAFVCTARFLMNSKELDAVQKQLAYEEVLLYLQEAVLRSRFVLSVEVLRYLYDLNAEFYKFNNLDRALDFPLGRAHPLPRYQPQINEECDVVRPYITMISSCNWVRCTVLAINGNGHYIVRYGNSTEQTTLKDLPWFAPLGTRSKDYDWRIGLKVGDQLDAQDTKSIWYLSTIAEESVEAGCKKVRVTFREFTEEGDKIDSDNRRYRGWGANEDEWFDVMSPRLRQPHTMHKRLCYYSSTVNNDYFMDDSFDVLYIQDYKREPFYAVLRTGICKSLTLPALFEQFVKLGGFYLYRELLTTPNSNIDILCHLSVVIGLTWFVPPKMAVPELHQDIITLASNYLLQNVKQLNAQRLEAISYAVDVLCRRLLTLTEKYDLMEKLRRDLILLLMPLNLEKQLTAMRLIQELLRPQRPYTAEGKINFINYLRETDLFRMVFNSATHDQVLTRSTPFLKFLLDNNLIGEADMDYLWRIYPPTDFRGRAVLHKVLGEVVAEMQHEQVEMLIHRIIEIREADITIDDLALLRSLKNKLYSKECTLRTLEFLWDLLTVKSGNVKVAVEEEAEKVFKGFITTVTDFDIKFQLLNDMVKRLRDVKSVKGEPALLKEYLMTYKEKRPEGETTTKPACLPEVMVYLASHDIYNLLYSLLEVQKIDDKIKELLEFMRFLMSNDPQTDFSPILRRVYEKLGPTEHVLNWLKELGPRSPSFLDWFFQTEPQAEPFKNLSLDGFKAVQSMFVDLNEHLHKLHHYKGKLVIEPKPGSETKDSIQIEYTNKKDFVYVLVSPMELSGLVFLEGLLEVVSNQLVYGKIIEFIVTVMVNLDDSLLDRTIEIRTSVIAMIVEHIRRVQQEPELTDKNKQKLLRNLNLLNQLMVETEVNGLFDLHPHFEQVDFTEDMKVKFENAVVNSKAPKEFEMEVRDNIPLWRLKLLLCEKLGGENPHKISLFKAKKQLEKRTNGKSLKELSISAGDVIRIETANVEELPKCHLVEEPAGVPTAKFEKVLQKWWSMFSIKHNNQQVVTAEGLFRLFKEHTKTPITEEDALKDTTTFGTNMQLTYPQFVQYFVHRARVDLTGFWRLLNRSGYRNDLRYLEEANFIQPVESLARQILSNDNVYTLLFSMLDNPAMKAVHTDLYKFLCMLPTSPRISQQLTGADFNPAMIADVHSPYQLSYLTTIISANLTNSIDQLYLFAERGGIDCICQKLESFGFADGASIYDIDDKNMIAGLLRILTTYSTISLMADPMVYTLADERLNTLELWEFVERLDKRIKEPPKEEVDKSVAFVSRVNLDFKRITAIATSLMKSLMVHYKTNYNKEATIETTRLCTLMNRWNELDLDVLLLGIISESLNIRRACMNLLFMRSRIEKGKLGGLLNRLLAMMPEEEVKYTITQYFELLCRLLQENASSEARADVDYKALAERLFKKILYHKSTERRNQQYVRDTLLNGYLQTLHTVLSKNAQLCEYFAPLKKDIINRCLFFDHPAEKIAEVRLTKEDLTSDKQSSFFEDYVICKTEGNRKLAMDIVLLLYKANPAESEFIESLIMNVLERLPAKLRKPSTKDSMVGLYNMGCICYINAMLQMTNSIEPFRNGIMMAEVDGRVTAELQRLMAYLFFSERQDFVPEDFLKCFVPPINPMIQQDTTEFLGMFFDCLQQELKDSPYRNLLKSIFQGTTVVQMLCHSCGKKRERKEEFFYYTVGVKDKNSLEEAMEGMHMGEVISDCLCQECHQRGDFTKRGVLGDLPNVMVVHLQRIVFNLDLFINTKIHTRLPFPLELNLEPYTKEGVELRESVGVEYLKKLSENEEEAKKFKERTLHNRCEKDYLMNLKAIIVHSGSADVGHYICIVKQEGRWVKLDDSRASIFVQSNMDSECFGGSFTAGEDWAAIGEQSKNAYVLIYEKEVKNLVKLEAEGAQLAHELAKLPPPTELDKPDEGKVAYSSFKTYNLEKYFREVWLDNHQLMVETHLFGEHYCKDFTQFMEGLLSACQSERKAELVSEVFFRLASYSGETGKLIEVLETCPVSDALYNKYLSDPKKLWDLLFHNDKNIRTGMARYMQHVLVGLLRQNPTDFIPVVQQIVDVFLPLLNTDIAKNWNKCESFFVLMRALVNESLAHPQLYHFFLSRHLIAQYVDFIMEKESPIKLTHKRHQMGNKFVAVEFGAAIETMLKLSTTSYLMSGINVELEKPTPEYLYHLTREEVLALSCMPFYLKMIKEKQALSDLGFLIHRLAIRNLKFSEEISRVILRCLNETMDRSEEVRGIMHLARRLIEIKDEFALQRMEFLLGYGKVYLSKSHRLSSVDQDIFLYSSTIEYVFPIECILSYLWSTRINNQLSALYVLNELLEWMCGFEWVTKYMSRQPAPNYTFTFYHEWIKPFLQNLKPILLEKKVDKEMLQKMLPHVLSCYDAYEKSLETNPPPYRETIVTGSVVVSTPTEKLKVPNENVFYWVNDVEVYCLKSQPMFQDSNNGALADVTVNGKLEAKNIDPESTVLYFMLPRDAPIPLGNDDKAMKIEGPEPAPIEPLFGEFPDPEIHTVAEKMEVQTETLPIKVTAPVPTEPPAPPAPPVRLDVKDLFTCDYYREIIVENRCDVNKFITVEFDNSMPAEVSNSILPTRVADVMRSSDIEAMTTLNKLDYKRPWGPTNFRVIVEDGDKWKKPNAIPLSYKIYGEQEEEKPQEAEPAPPEPVSAPPVHDAMQTEQNVDGINCGVCTLLNPIGSVVCDACGSDL